jgi:hypothetical protein
MSSNLAYIGVVPASINGPRTHVQIDGFRRPFSGADQQEEDDDDQQVCCLRDGPGGCAAVAPDDGRARGCAVLRLISMLPGSPAMLHTVMARP